jgi:hypothetical protein
MEPESAKILAEATKTDIGRIEKLASLSYDDLVKETAQ